MTFKKSSVKSSHRLTRLPESLDSSSVFREVKILSLLISNLFPKMFFS